MLTHLTVQFVTMVTTESVRKKRKVGDSSGVEGIGALVALLPSDYKAMIVVVVGAKVKRVKPTAEFVGSMAQNERAGV